MRNLHEFAYDRFQREAIEAVQGEESVLVAAPTGAGKTVIADHVILQALEQQRPVIYTAPIKALSNQKYREFSARYGDLVGIVTGDVAINPRAPVRIMTTEIYRNTLLDEPDQIEDVAWVIFDEVHYLDDEERGTVWEEAILLTPLRTRILCLSATVPNIEEIAGWMEEVLGRRTKVIVETKRPVPLHLRFQCQGRIVERWKEARELLHVARVRGMRWRGRGVHVHGAPNRLSELIKYIRGQDGLPCIYFAFGRRRTEELAEEVLGYLFLPAEQHAVVERRFEELCRRFDVLREPSAQRLRPLIRHGVAYHHAGMLPTLKEVVEQLFTARLLQLIFTTETFALGINMPARSVVFDSLRKYYPSGLEALRPREFQQMAGRAGRRGLDTEGFVYVRLTPGQNRPEEVQHTLFAGSAPVVSQFNASYATLLNLYELHGEQVVELYPKTLHYYQASKRRRREALERFIHRLDVLKESGCIRQGELTVRGDFARWMFGYELYLSELFERGLLDRFSAHELAFALSCLVYEPRRGVPQPRQIPAQFGWVVRELERTHRVIAALEDRHDIEPVAPPPHPQLGGALDVWLKGGGFERAVEVSAVDEGELVRYFRMIIQLLRQLAQAPHTSDKLRGSAREARELIDRGVVDAERQLRA
ncbi:MAG: DEAD/DEAH box helicase [bacterium]|nr:DEAD/DEAH box helicase [bacterium]